MYTAKIYLNSVSSSPINFILGADIRTTQTSGAQNGCHGNTSCLVTGIKILGFMTSLTTYCGVANISN